MLRNSTPCSHLAQRSTQPRKVICSNVEWSLLSHSHVAAFQPHFQLQLNSISPASCQHIAPYLDHMSTICL